MLSSRSEISFRHKIALDVNQNRIFENPAVRALLLLGRLAGGLHVLEGRCACTLSQKRLLCLSSLCNYVELATGVSAWKHILFKMTSEFRLLVQPPKAKAKKECYCSLRMEESSRTLRSNEEGNKKLQNRRFGSNFGAWEKQER